MSSILTPRYLTLLQTAFTDGHVIGLRFQPSLDPRSLSDSALRQSFAQQSDVIKGVIGVHPKFVRINDGYVDDRVARIATEMGFVLSGWNIDLMGMLSIHYIS